IGTVVDPLRFRRQLLDAASKRGIVTRLVSAQPEQWRMGPLTLHIDHRRTCAELRYARAPVVSRIPLRAASILNAWHRARSLLIHGSLAPDTLLPVLAGIYGRLLHRGGKPPGDRVPLRELVARLRRSRRGY